MRKLELTYGILAGLFFASCAGVTYTYYSLSLPDGCYAQGKLLAHEPKDDKALSDCAPDPDPLPGASPVPKPNKMKCVVQFTSEYRRLRLDKDRCDHDLIACQRSRAAYEER